MINLEVIRGENNIIIQKRLRDNIFQLALDPSKEKELGSDNASELPKWMQLKVRALCSETSQITTYQVLNNFQSI